VQVAADIDDLHSSNTLGDKTSLDERGESPGYWHDIMTGSNPDGTLASGDVTCRNWTSTQAACWLVTVDKRGPVRRGTRDVVEFRSLERVHNARPGVDGRKGALLLFRDGMRSGLGGIPRLAGRRNDQRVQRVSLNPTNRASGDIRWRDHGNTSWLAPEKHCGSSARGAREHHERTAMADTHSDALVFFGATGDLAFKKIFPALQAMARRGGLDVPVIGVAKAGWTLDQLRERARDSVEKYGGLDRAAFDKLVGLLRYVDGDYKDPSTFAALRQHSERAAPAHYLAIPPPLFGPVVEQLAQSGCAKGSRVVVEKPFGQDLPSARALNRILLGTFVEGDIFRIDHYWASVPSTTCCSFALPIRSWRPSGIALRRERANHDGRGLRHPGPRRLLRRDGRHSRRRPESPLPGVEQPRHGAAGEDGQRVTSGREGEGSEVHSAHLGG
jgi:hypothetical protein